MQAKIKVLVGVDGSEQSMEAVRYVAGFFPKDRTDVVLLHIFANVPESFLDLGRDPAFRGAVLSVSAWRDETNRRINQFMETGKNLLLKAGYPASQISIKTIERKHGFARDLLSECKEGFDVLALGRSGVSRLKDMIMGSIPNKLLGKTEIPMVVVGGAPDPEKVLVGFDGSEGSLRAIRCMANLMALPERDVMLCHVIRPLNVYLGMNKIFSQTEEQEWVNASIESITPGMENARQTLIEGGFTPERVKLEILKGKRSRADALSSKAVSDGYETIVLGLRGLSRVEEFIMGRVSSKVLHMAWGAAVWLV
jgi:nucleotide-binding universal stress UspA family protein